MEENSFAAQRHLLHFPRMKQRQASLPGTVTIRDATQADIEAISAIYAHHVRFGLASFEEAAPSPEEMARRFLNIRAQKLFYLVAEAGEAVIGYAYAAPYRTRSAYRYTLEDSVYLRPEAAGFGIGRKLLSALITRCEAQGYRRMIAVIGDSANLPSIRLHERLGFAHAGLLPAVGFKFGRWVDSVLMQRPLGPGDASLPEELA
jgi:phosphinothricin acetyltransferase